MGKYNLQVTPDASLRDAGGRLSPLEVDLVGVKEADINEWTGYSVDQYFSGEDARRRNAAPYTRTLLFSNDKSAAQMVPASDPIWQVWGERGVTQLFVFASSRSMQSQPGNETRRKMIPLTTDRWDTNIKQIDIIVKSSGVECPTPQKVMQQ